LHQNFVSVAVLVGLDTVNLVEDHHGGIEVFEEIPDNRIVL